MVANILKPALIGVVLLVFVWAFFAYFYQPNIQIMDSLNREIAGLQKSVGDGRAILKERSRFLSDESSVRGEIALLKRRIPRSRHSSKSCSSRSADPGADSLCRSVSIAFAYL